MDRATAMCLLSLHGKDRRRVVYDTSAMIAHSAPQDAQRGATAPRGRSIDCDDRTGQERPAHAPGAVRLGSGPGDLSAGPRAASASVSGTGRGNAGLTAGSFCRLWADDLNLDTPGDVSFGSRQLRWWRCPDWHEWSRAVGATSKRLRARPGCTGCPICDGKVVIAGVNDLASTHPELGAEWHPTHNDRRASEVVAGSSRFVWWRCRSCRHTWRAQPNMRANRATGCPASTGGVATKGHSLADAVTILRGEWSKRNERRATDYRPNSQQQVWRVCHCCGEEWRQLVQSWTHGHGHGCQASLRRGTRSTAART
jgi:hypothetical protein